MEEKERFVRIMRRVEAFTGVDVLTYCVMDNHFHLLLEVPDGECVDLSDEAFVARLRKLYTARECRQIEQELHSWRGMGADGAADELKQRYVARMYDLSEFMKTLKQRFTQWFNGRHRRRGTLWESRFKSVLVEGDWGSLMTVAAYIDLNPVRADIVRDPADYRWCGYAEGIAGKRVARKGLAAILELDGQPGHWTHVLAEYRTLLYGRGESESYDEHTGRVIKHGLDRRSVKQVLDKGGRLGVPALLRCRVRYFTDGCAIGTKAFVNGFFDRRRAQFGPNRTSGARKFRGAYSDALYSLRDLRLDVIQIE
jgi:REP element-mobilizing transposase RayT